MQVDVKTGEWTDRTKRIVAFRNSAYAPKNRNLTVARIPFENMATLRTLRFLLFSYLPRLSSLSLIRVFQVTKFRALNRRWPISINN